MDTLKTFTDQVHKMRLAQERYFELAVLARKSNIHTKEKKDALTIAKNLEKQVDESIKEINKSMVVPKPPEEERPAMIVQPLTD